MLTFTKCRFFLYLMASRGKVLSLHGKCVSLKMFNIWRVDYDDVISSELSLILGLFQLFALNVGHHKMLMPKHRKTFKKCVAAVRNER